MLCVLLCSIIIPCIGLLYKWFGSGICVLMLLTCNNLIHFFTEEEEKRKKGKERMRRKKRERITFPHKITYDSIINVCFEIDPCGRFSRMSSKMESESHLIVIFHLLVIVFSCLFLSRVSFVKTENIKRNYVFKPY